MKRTVCLLTVLALLLAGCNVPTDAPSDNVATTTSSATTTATATTTSTTTATAVQDAWDDNIIPEEELQQLIYNYNYISTLQTAQFDGAAPIGPALSYYIAHNNLASDDPPADLAVYLVDGHTPFPLYKIPTQIVDDWLLKHFTALDYTDLDPERVQDNCYLLSAGGRGGTSKHYLFRQVEATENVLSFVCYETAPPNEETIYLAQRFRLTKKGENWTITAVELLYQHVNDLLVYTPLEPEDARQLAYLYNTTPILQDLNIGGGIPLAQALSFYSYHNHLGDPSIEPVFQSYRWDVQNYAEVPQFADLDTIPSYAEEMVYFKIPVKEVHDYVLNFFSAIGHSETNALHEDGQHYVFMGVGGGTPPEEYVIRELQVNTTAGTASFLCDTVDPATGKTAKTQRFLVIKSGNLWRIHSVETITQ